MKNHPVAELIPPMKYADMNLLQRIAHLFSWAPLDLSPLGASVARPETGLVRLADGSVVNRAYLRSAAGKGART